MPFEVPSSWVWTTVGEISQSILYGVSESAKSRGTYRLLRITDIQDNTVNWNTVPFTDYEDEKAEAYLLKDGDILFARTGATVGKSYLVNNLQEKAIYASYLIRVKTNHYVLPEFVKKTGVQVIIISHSPLVIMDKIRNNDMYNFISIDEEYTNICIEKIGELF